MTLPQHETAFKLPRHNQQAHRLAGLLVDREVLSTPWQMPTASRKELTRSADHPDRYVNFVYFDLNLIHIFTPHPTLQRFAQKQFFRFFS